MKFFFSNFLKGILIGVSVITPGMSGGTTAIFLQIYEKILSSVAQIFKNFKKNAAFLSVVSIGAVLGIYIATFPINYLIENFNLELSFIIIGLVIGSMFLFFEDFKSRPLKNTALILAGFFITISANEIFANKFQTIPIVFVALLMSVALILPGISITNILISFDCYENMISAINNLQLGFLTKLLFFLVLWIFALTKLITYFYKKYPISSNMLILGMVAASIKQIYVGLPCGANVPACILLFISGLLFGISFVFFSKRADGV